ncbi:MAG: sugar transferase [Actinomycetota bacterium]|nr:sugar transferase [Actinomycetota bacterium]
MDARGLPAHRRQKKGILVVGDERIRSVVESARPPRRIVPLHDVETSAVPESWDEIVVDANMLDHVRDRNPALLRQAHRVWIIPPQEDDSGRASDPFSHPLPLGGRVFKRSLDIVLSVVGLLLALPVLLLAIIVVQWDSAGPAIFKQERVGRNGRRFWLYKIRTMHVDSNDARHRAYQSAVIRGTADPCGGLFKLADDARITRIGAFLRRLSIDEVPQLWNVLKGEMSMVGPRPALPWEVELYSVSAWERLRVDPGLTGLWQVSGRSLVTFDEMVDLDVQYRERWSVLLDLSILAKTPAVVLSGAGAA